MAYNPIYGARDSEDELALRVAEAHSDVDDNAPSSNRPQKMAIFNQEQNDLLPKSGSQLDQARRRRIAGGLLAAFVLLLIVGAVLLIVFARHNHTAKPKRSAASGSNRNFTFERIFDGSIQPYVDEEYKWMPRSAQLVSYDTVTGVLKASSPDGASKTVLATLPPQWWDTLSFESISPDEKYALMSGEKTQMFRHGSAASYCLVSLAPVGRAGTTINPQVQFINNRQQLRLVKWVGHGSSFAFVLMSSPDIYYQHDITDASSLRRLTSNGKSQEIVNGVADWLYEEEVLHVSGALWGSPGGGHVAYVTFNETKVDFFHWVTYGDPAEDYVKVENLRYPKAGRQNPDVTLTVQSVGSAATAPALPVVLSPPPALTGGTGSDYYITNVVWLNSTHISALWMPRNQTESYLASYDVSSPPSSGAPLAAQSVLKWRAPVGWVEIYSYKPALSGRAVLMQLPRHKISEKPHYVHLALVHIHAGHADLQPEFLTNGAWEIAGLESVNAEKGYVLAQATIADHPEYHHLVKVSLHHRDVTNPTCLTCNATRSCLYNEFKTSANGSYFYCFCQGPGLPRVQVAMVPDEGHGKVVRLLQNFTSLAAVEASVDLPTWEYLRLPVNGNSLPALRITPHGGPPSRKMPTLMFGYNGPLVQTVKAQHPFMYSGYIGLWLLYLASVHGFQVFIVDGRGTPYLGDSFGKAQFMNAGAVESADQLGAAQYIMQNYNADPKRMAFWGWSYGGFLSLYIGTRLDNVFTTCMATAPVTDWNYYDTAYTERMMGLPSENTNYLTTSIVKRAGSFGNTNILLVHGSGDDNVHFQNTAQLAASLTIHNVQFRMQVYTDKAHGLSGAGVHMYTMMTEFLLNSFKMEATL